MSTSDTVASDLRGLTAQAGANDVAYEDPYLPGRPILLRAARPKRHSAGGQFVHRMISLGFRDRVAVAATANAGTYAMPDPGVAFPDLT